jgi:phospholipid/cholesterol/gamma-HCH transport system substrate-binding protein
MANTLNEIVGDVKDGKGSLGSILRDTAIAKNLSEAIVKINNVGSNVDSLVSNVNKIALGIENDINKGKGTANALLKDSMIVTKLNASLDNIQQGTDGFNQNMEALKHNFLLRGYFKKLEKKKEKEAKKKNTSQL